MLSQVLSAFLLQQCHRSAGKEGLSERGHCKASLLKGKWSAGTSPSPLPLLSAHYRAAMAITQPKLCGRPKLLHLHLNFCSL